MGTSHAGGIERKVRVGQQPGSGQLPWLTAKGRHLPEHAEGSHLPEHAEGSATNQ
jgi:hypothetical protein